VGNPRPPCGKLRLLAYILKFPLTTKIAIIFKIDSGKDYYKKQTSMTECNATYSILKGSRLAMM